MFATERELQGTALPRTEGVKWKKRVYLSLLALIAVSTPQMGSAYRPGVSDPVIIVRPEPSSRRDLLDRIGELERVIRQLQSRVRDLEVRQSDAPRPLVTCYIKTPFSGTYYASEPTETMARAAALQRCERETTSGIGWCSDTEVKCGR